MDNKESCCSIECLSFLATVLLFNTEEENMKVKLNILALLGENSMNKIKMERSLDVVGQSPSCDYVSSSYLASIQNPVN